MNNDRFFSDEELDKSSHLIHQGSTTNNFNAKKVWLAEDEISVYWDYFLNHASYEKLAIKYGRTKEAIKTKLCKIKCGKYYDSKAGKEICGLFEKTRHIWRSYTRDGCTYFSSIGRKTSNKVRKVAEKEDKILKGIIGKLGITKWAFEVAAGLTGRSETAVEEEIKKRNHVKFTSKRR